MVRNTCVRLCDGFVVGLVSCGTLSQAVRMVAVQENVAPVRTQ